MSEERRWQVTIDITLTEEELDSLTERLFPILDEYDKGGFDLSMVAT